MEAYVIGPTSYDTLILGKALLSSLSNICAWDPRAHSNSDNLPSHMVVITSTRDPFFCQVVPLLSDKRPPDTPLILLAFG